MEKETVLDNPFDTGSAWVNQVLMTSPIILGALALARHRRWKLLVYLPASAAFVTVWRKFICARCRYYGEPCSTMLGVFTAAMMPRDEVRELDRNAMIADFAFIGALALFPLPQVLRSRRLAAAYLISVMAGMSSILLNACGRCGNGFCPMKDLRRSLTGGCGACSQNSP